MPVFGSRAHACPKGNKEDATLPHRRSTPYPDTLSPPIPIRAHSGPRLPIFPYPEAIIRENEDTFRPFLVFSRRSGEAIYSHVTAGEGVRNQPFAPIIKRKPVIRIRFTSAMTGFTPERRCIPGHLPAGIPELHYPAFFVWAGKFYRENFLEIFSGKVC